MATKEKKSRARRPRQPALIPDMEPPRVPELDDAADEYHDLKERRMELLQEEVEAKERVKGLMHEHGLTTYTTASDLICTREEEEAVKVRRKKAPKGQNGEAE